MGLTRITSDGITDGTITGTDLATNVDLVDDQKLRLGTGNDLQIYHDGSNSYLEDTGTGKLILLSSQVQINNPASNETMANFIQNGAVELYHDDSKKFETTSTGVTVTGTSTVNGVVLSQGTSGRGGIFGQIEVGYLGTYLTVQPASGYNDLHFNYDNGSTVQIGHTSGSTLKVNGNIIPKTDSTSDLGLTGTRFRAAYVDTYYGDGSNLTGINTDLVSDTSPQLGGDLDTNSHNISLDDNHRVNFGDSSDFQVYYDGSARLTLSGGETFNVQCDDFHITDASNTTVRFRVDADGATSLRHNGSEKLQTTSSGIDVTGRITTDSITIQDDGSNEPLLHVRADDANPWAFLISNDNYHSGTSTGLKWYVANNGNAYQHLQGNGTFEEFHIQQSNGGGTTNTSIKLNTSRAVELNYQGNTKFSTTSAGIEVTGRIALMDSSDSAGSGNALWFGASNDFRIFHDGTSNHLRGTGSHATMFWTSNVERWYIDSNGHYKPAANGNYDIGASNARVRNIYTNDLNLSNEGSSNDVDGTWGSYTIQEGEESLFLINRRNGKKYKFNLTEVK